MLKPPRKVSLTFRITPQEHKIIKAAAKRADSRSVCDWVRDVVTKAAQPQKEST